MGTLRKIGLAALLGSSALWAGIPIQNMSVKSLGVEYQGALRGQIITKAKVMSHERTQGINLHYAPVQYVLLTVGAGGDRISTDPWNRTRFVGRYGFSPSAAIAAFTPRFAKDVFGLTGGVQFLYLNSEDGDKRMYRSYIVGPSVGLKVSAGKYFDVEAGARWHLMWGAMENEKSGFKADFSNNETFRGYCSLTLHSPLHGVYMSVDFDGSREIGTDWSDGPAEATLGLRVGVILRPDYMSRKIEDRSSRYFPAYKKMKKRQDEMAEEIE